MSWLRLTAGFVFAGDYEIVAPLAEGGMGSVYVAKQLSTGKERALKILQAQFVSDDRTRERFAQEARAGSQVDSEHVVEVVGAGIDGETGMPWLAMELLKGEDLHSYADRVGPLSPSQVLEIFRQLCHGLSAAHVSGLVHRDLKPENVFLATARRVGVPFTVKILDFGIAKVVRVSSREVTDAVGTPTWMAPEQTEAGHAITPASDVWALGLIAFRLLTGFMYWKASNATELVPMAILREVVFEPMEPASARARAFGSPVPISSTFDAWFARAVAREPGKRFPNSTAALAALELCLGNPSRRGELSSPFAAPVEPLPATIPGPHFASLVSEEPPPDTRPATLVGPFTGPTNPAVEYPQTSFPPPSEDVDTYQKRIAGGKLWAWAAAMTLAVLAAGAWQVRATSVRPIPFSGHETEPNDRAPEANTLPFGEKVRGQLGRRLDAERSDRDFFRTVVPQASRLVQVHYRALPNIAPCLFFYRVGVDEPLLRYCTGQPARDLSVPFLRVEPGEYYVAVMQDREQYTGDPPPPVLENISDSYELSLVAAEPVADQEIEPNDTRDTATHINWSSSLRGRLSWMRDVDVICVDGLGSAEISVEDASPRPRGAVLEVTPIGGPSDGIPVRVHHQMAKGEVTERDVRSPWRSPKKGTGTVCVSLALVPDIWSSPPFPRVPPAGDQEYVVRTGLP